MVEADLRVLLDEYVARVPEHFDTVRRFHELLSKRRDALLRSCFDPGHVTASAFVVAPSLESCALLLHKKLEKWLQPGGHVDGEAAVWRAAQREVMEETGLAALRLWSPAGSPAIFDLDIHPIPPLRTEPAHEHFDIRFLFLADAPEQLAISEESIDLAWVPLARLAEWTTEPSVLRLRERYATSAMRT
ncbi:MAG: NUDIX hydrolase [Planctomycetota bacterium]